MNILMMFSEVVGYVKTGGLADVAAALPKSLAELGHNVKIVMPYYRVIKTNRVSNKEPELKPLSGDPMMKVQMGSRKIEECEVYIDTMPGSSVEVYFIKHEFFFNRDELYGDAEDPMRFSFFCRSIFELCRKINWYPEILHANDWQSALVPVYLKYIKRTSGSEFEKTASILTIHNLAFQGMCEKTFYDYITLDMKDKFSEQEFEFGGKLNILKAGLYGADKLNTVSRKYAEETQKKKTNGEDYYGCDLDSVLCDLTEKYTGILNGIDTGEWNPKQDPFLPAAYSYSVNNMDGKAKAKETLQKYFGLPINSEIPIIGMVGRLDAHQKGLSELFNPDYGCAWPFCRNMGIQMVLLGDGKDSESEIKKHIQMLASEAHNFRARIGYDNELAHLIEAGSDFFLMPSRYEPCGLNQMYSLIYGTIPIVRKTGGLADTVENYDQKGGGTGFMFEQLTPIEIYKTVARAVLTWYNRRDHIKEMRLRGMKQDFSWEKSAREYVELYKEALKKAIPADVTK
ncbi:glycogen synthase [Treponema sp. R80B11-R83G3]